MKFLNFVVWVEMVSSTSYKKVKTGGTDGEECPTGTMYDGG